MGGGGLARDDEAERAAGTQASAPAVATFSDAPCAPSKPVGGLFCEGRPTFAAPRSCQVAA